MKLPLILADFGPVFFVFIGCALSLPALLSITSIIIGYRKKKDQHSVSGIALGIISISGAAFFSFSASPDWTDPMTYVIFSPFPLGPFGIVLSARKKRPNQAPEPTALLGRGSS